MTYHSDYARTCEPAPMQVWTRGPDNNYTQGAILILKVDPTLKYDAITYVKLQGMSKGRKFTCSLNNLPKIGYQFSH